MSDSYELKGLYWNSEGKHDKIWGFVETDGGNIFNFWGKRQVVDAEGMTENGKRPSLQFKKHESLYDLENLAHKKERKGYINVPLSGVDVIVPGFTEFFEYALITARMTGKVRTDDWDNE